MTSPGAVTANIKCHGQNCVSLSGMIEGASR